MKISFSLLLMLFFCNYQLSAQKIDSSKILRVLTYNIYHGETMKGDFDLDLIAKVIKESQPDIVALQEVDYKTNRAKKMDLVTELAFRTKMAPLFGRAMYYDGGEYGEGILSNYTFINTKNHPLPYTSGKEPRAALEVTFELKSGDTIQFVGTHLDHERDDFNRRQQARELIRLYKHSPHPVILAGDLNATPESHAMQDLFKHWTPSFNNKEATYPANAPTKKIDYILYRPANRWRILEKRIIVNEIASDHCAVLVVLELLDN